MNMSKAPVVERIEVAEATFRLREPVLVGGGTKVADRDYTFVRITSNNGHTGHSYGITRRLPIGATVERFIAPHYLGAEVTEPGRLQERTAAALGIVRPDTCVSRALSLVDIALWDLAGLESEQPVHALLGSHDGGAPARVMSVEGYVPASGETADVRRRIDEVVDSGIETIKFSYLGDPESSHQAIETLAPAALGGDLSVVVDLLWSMTAVSEAQAVAARFEDTNIVWFEDPYPGHLLRREENAKRALGRPVAYGDEATDPHVLDELARLERIDVVRVDATTIGGLTGAMSVATRARNLGRPVACHVYPEVHQHLAYATAGVDYVEMFPADGRCDAADQFRTPTFRHNKGTVEAPTVPGLGLELKWDAITRRSDTLLAVENPT